MAYYTTPNTGKGFITHTDNESSHVAGFPGDVWVTENSTWASRVSAVSKTKTQAQALVDAAISGSYYLEGADSGSQVEITLP
jgi:hypothetical protein|tara:strand:- start:437 stop:682 length:246 start_codon:yes stop_codon:yes gene_type:complete